MKIIFKIYKILSALFLATLILGFIFPTYIRDNIIYILETISHSGEVGVEVGVRLLLTSILIFWFAPKTLLKFISTKGQVKRFWDEV